MRSVKGLLMIGLAILVFASSISASAVSENSVTGSAIIKDGDSLVVGGQEIRLFGIDAPEYHQTCVDLNTHIEWNCGKESRRFLAHLIDSSAVYCQKKDIDRYHRWISICSIPSRHIEINQVMVSQGQAIAYRYFSMRYTSDEDQAKAQHLGIWNSSFLEPYRWRKAHPWHPIVNRLKNSAFCCWESEQIAAGKRRWL